MADSRDVRCYDYVPAPFERVRDLLRSDGVTIFSRATSTANERARALVATLRLNVGTVEVGVDVQLRVKGITDELDANGDPGTRLRFSWEATPRAGLFPTMDAVLSVYPLSPEETQLDLDGRYQPPFGTLGNALDAAAGHRVAEATVLRLLREVRAHMMSELGLRP
ncbi:MAG TPA: hypothetical protein VFF12_11240 [Myxococcaceae bacterium]|nr:hypothetical protein [Myxococcaceae bacterium]